MSEPLIYSVVYTCAARSEMAESDIQQILDVSRRNNTSKGITGILFYRGKQFLQVLEGEQAVVKQLLDTISCDPRQKGLAVLDESRLRTRYFGQWAMNYRSLDTYKPKDSEANGFVALPPELDSAPLRLRKLLVSFMNR